jgi:hypothetical protein
MLVVELSKTRVLISLYQSLQLRTAWSQKYQATISVGHSAPFAQEKAADGQMLRVHS